MLCNVTVLQLWSKSLKRAVEGDHIAAVIQPVTLLNFTPAQVISEDFDQRGCSENAEETFAICHF